MKVSSLVANVNQVLDNLYLNILNILSTVLDKSVGLHDEWKCQSNETDFALWSGTIIILVPQQLINSRVGKSKPNQLHALS